MTGSMSSTQQRQQTNRTHDGRYAEGSRSEPDVDLGAQLAAGPRSGHHASSAQAYREHVEDLQRQLTDARIVEKRSRLEQRDFYLRYEDSGWAHSADEAVWRDVASSQGGRRYWLSKADGSLIFSPGGYLARSGVL